MDGYPHAGSHVCRILAHGFGGMHGMLKRDGRFCGERGVA